MWRSVGRWLSVAIICAGGRAACAYELVPVDSGVTVELQSQIPDASGFRAERLTAVLFDASASNKKGAVIVINSSGGVQPHTELFWGRLLAAHGMAALVVDSFTARGIVRTTDDQTRVQQSQSDADAVAGYRFLAGRVGVDAARIAVMGMSKGGVTALNDALPGHMRWLGAQDVTFAAHIALTPGACDIQFRDVVTTNRPILFMLADLDDYTPTTPCLELAERMRRAGNSRIERAVYPNAYHAMEWTGGVIWEKDDQNFSKCRGFIEPNGTATLGDPPRNMSGDQLHGWALKNCVTLGAHVGGEPDTKQHVVDDLIGFMRRHGLIRDGELAELLGDCGRFRDHLAQLLCQRGLGGSVNDVVALGRLFARGEGVAADDVFAARLFRYGFDQGSPFGQFEYGLFLQSGRGGLTRDPAAAVRLFKLAAAQDYSPAAVALAAAYRDGRGTEVNEAEAIRLFRLGVLNRNSWAYADYGQYLMTGGAGVEKNSAEALRLFRLSADLGNPWGQYKLAQSLERGDGVPTDRSAALALYRQSAAFAWAGRAMAESAAKRLEAEGPAQQARPQTASTNAAVSSANARAASPAPDEELLGKPLGYPIGKRENWFSDEKVRVGSFSHLDRIMPSNFLQKSASPLPLPTAANVPKLEYWFDNQTRSIDHFLARQRITGLLLIKDGQILVERYQYDRTPADRLVSHSMAKSIVSMGIGLALAERKIASIDDTVAKYVSGLAGSAYGDTSIRNLLRMGSGVHFSETYDGHDDAAQFASARYDRGSNIEALRAYNVHDVPQGMRFRYASSETVALAVLLRQVTGGSLSDYLTPRLWQPMGAEADASWVRTKDGLESGAGGFSATLRDYGRLGILLANDGVLGGRQIIPKDYLLDATDGPRQPNPFQPGRATPYFGYGYLFWLFPGEKRRFALLGAYGQAIFVDPQLKLVLVMTAAGRQVDSSKEALHAERNALWRGIVDTFGRWCEGTLAQGCD